MAHSAKGRTRFDIHDVQRQSLLLCGATVQTTAIFLAYYRPIQMDAAAQASSVTTPVSLLFSLLVALGLVALGLGNRAVGRAVGNPWWLGAAAVLFAASSVASASFAPDSIPALATDFLARVSSAFLMLGWLRLFANFDSDTVLQTLPSVMAFGLVAIVGAVQAGPALRLPTLVALTALGTLWLAAAARLTRLPAEEELESGKAAAREKDVARQSPREGAGRPGGGAGRSLAVTCAVAFLLSVLLGVLCAVPFHESASSTSSPFFLYFLLMMGAALVLLSCMALLRHDNPLSPQILHLRVGVPVALAALACLLGTVLQPHFGPLINAVGRMCMGLSLLVCFLLVARQGNTPLIRTSAFGQAAFLAGNSLGMFAGLALPRLVAMPGDHLLILSVVILLLTSEALFVFVVLYQFSRRISARVAAEAAVEEEAAAAPQDNLDGFIERFALSEKESEVLRLTVRGRSRQRIAEALFVSPGTVNTYFYRIYQKVGVHTRQELLDRIEEFSEEEPQEA